MAGRPKSLDSLNRADLAAGLGVAPNSSRLDGALKLIFPKRKPGTRGEALLVSAADVLRAAVILSLQDLHVEDGICMIASAALSKWLASDLSAGRNAGFIVTYTDVTGDVFRVAYLDRGTWDRWDTAKEAFESPDSKGRPCVSMSLIDLHVLTESVFGRIAERFREFAAGQRLTVDEMKEALTEASKMRDLVESAYRD